MFGKPIIPPSPEEVARNFASGGVKLRYQTTNTITVSPTPTPQQVEPEKVEANVNLKAKAFASQRSPLSLEDAAKRVSEPYAQIREEKSYDIIRLKDDIITVDDIEGKKEDLDTIIAGIGKGLIRGLRIDESNQLSDGVLNQISEEITNPQSILSIVRFDCFLPDNGSDAMNKFNASIIASTSLMYCFTSTPISVEAQNALTRNIEMMKVIATSAKDIYEKYCTKNIEVLEAKDVETMNLIRRNWPSVDVVLHCEDILHKNCRIILKKFSDRLLLEDLHRAYKEPNTESTELAEWEIM